MNYSFSNLRERNRVLFQIKNGPWVIYGILIIFVLFNTIFNPYFATAFNISNIISQSTALMLTSVGQSFVIIGGGFDFSVGGVVSLTTCIVATQMKDSGISMFLVVILALFVGALLGGINGTGVALFRINPFIMTLGTMSVAQGAAFLLREYPGGYVPPVYRKGMTETIGFIPVPVLLMLGAVIVGIVLFKKTRFGRYTYAIGGNDESARAAGINVNGIRVSTFVVSALFATIGGLFMAARIASGDPRIGESFPLDSITAVVLGGVIIGGGRGSLIGVVAGVFLIVVLNNVLTLFDVSPYYQYIVKGVLLGVAVAVTFRKEERQYH
jgi:ribose transport system permease protein